MMNQPATGVSSIENLDMEDRTGYDPITDSYYWQFNTDQKDSIWDDIVSVVATLTDRDPISLDPLYSIIDPDA